MCGNYNHNSSDDNLMSNKKPTNDVIELGNSWKSDGDSDAGSVGYSHYIYSILRHLMLFFPFIGHPSVYI